MKNVPDDTIYRLENGTRVRIVAEKEFPLDPRNPIWLNEILKKKSEYITVARVKDGHRIFVKAENILTEKEWLALKNKG